MTNEQIVNQLAALFRENEVEVSVIGGEFPTMTLHPDALGKDADLSVKMCITADCSEQDYIRFDLLTFVMSGVYPEMHLDISGTLNELNMKTSFGSYIYFDDQFIIAHRYTLFTAASDYPDNVVLAVSKTLNAINQDIQYLEDF